MMEMAASPKGWATFAWQSDYGQFYLVDREDEAFEPPTEITPEMEARCLFVMPSGITVYTQSCLQQHIRIAIYDREPAHPVTEPISDKPWTHAETVEVRFPSKSFAISSPSMPDPLPNGPIFLVDSALCSLRINWMEFEGARDDSVPIEPDVIDIAIWPGRPAER
ncbi:hypothetical protein NFO65_26305 [Neorhizobium galegae]|uniref:hypothetical protein n=1 Tax=Neorhizobium galegae TaxID=399 RepID=UPI00062188E2|nr:hypothetical protein [Neorhizobium galegae]MCQ1574242.1 hypothetical protein [Neorhizobium galegae]MCQ1837622.1 hypothetical protein [Neorhizobium galegae]UIY31681.1 hypothetical protein LZK73_32515 [Neorhizobium galegae]CDZ67957.1 Hypothetical protein NGAL_HAMBI2605_62400 [Neorhizobium galegae bv. orientalis]